MSSSRGLQVRLVPSIVVTLLTAGLLTACSAEDDDTVLVVYAAASLRSTFEALGDDFEAGHDGVDVEFNFAGSSTLVAQLREGAPADVFASADAANMAKLVDEELNGSAPEVFARNTLAIAVPPGNAAGVTSLDDLGRSELTVVVCQAEVPCGAAALAAARAAGVVLAPDSEEQSATDVLNKVTADVADAGLVYVTDVIAAGDRVEEVALPRAAAVVNDYPITTLAASEHTGLAQEFVDLVLSPAGRDVLRDAGFRLP